MFVLKEVDMTRFGAKSAQHAMTEVSVLAALNHPNIIAFEEAFVRGEGTDRETLCIVMEYARGGDLSHEIYRQARVKREHFAERQIWYMLTEICLAVKHMHDRRVLHRDLKPGNIFLSRTKHVKVGDFGATTVLSHTLAMAETTVGTPNYLAPELAKGKPYDAKADVWSIGVTLYRMCTFRFPFEGPTLTATLDLIVAGRPRRIPRCYSSELAEVLKAMLQKSPSARPTINELLSHRFPKLHAHAMRILGPELYDAEFSHSMLHSSQWDFVLPAGDASSQAPSDDASQSGGDRAFPILEIRFRRLADERARRQSRKHSSSAAKRKTPIGSADPEQAWRKSPVTDVRAYVRAVRLLRQRFMAPADRREASCSLMQSSSDD